MARGEALLWFASRQNMTTVFVRKISQHFENVTDPRANRGENYPLLEAVLKRPAADAPKTTEKEPFTAWGKEVGSLQAGLGFRDRKR